MVKCARSMDISVRTLRRQLADNQTTFSKVIETWRLKTAKQLLNKRKTPIAEIATHLGYNHSSNFERAFKRWTGVSPSEFRAKSKKPTGPK